MGEVHINRPTTIGTSLRILPKYCRKFIKSEFKYLDDAMGYGTENYKKGFRIFRQSCFEWYEPLNTELVKVGDITKEEL